MKCTYTIYGATTTRHCEIDPDRQKTLQGTRNATGEPANIPNPSIPVSLRAENNLKLAAYWCKFRVKTSKDTVPADIQLDEICKIRSLRDWELAHEDPQVPDNLINNKDWTKTMDGLVEHLRNCLGTTGIPLAYVVRESIGMPDDNATWQSRNRNRANTAQAFSKVLSAALVFAQVAVCALC